MIDLFRVDIINGNIKWKKDNMINKNYTCGYCGAYVSSDKGMPLLEQGHASSTKNLEFIFVLIATCQLLFIMIFRFQALDLVHR